MSRSFPRILLFTLLFSPILFVAIASYTTGYAIKAEQEILLKITSTQAEAYQVSVPDNDLIIKVGGYDRIKLSIPSTCLKFTQVLGYTHYHGDYFSRSRVEIYRDGIIIKRLSLNEIADLPIDKEGYRLLSL